MTEIKKYMARNGRWIVVGVVLTGVFVKMAYAVRGYMAYGGEWLTLPLILMVLEIVKNVGDMARCLLGTEDDYEPDRD